MIGILQQGNFTSTGASRLIALRGDVDWFAVYNVTQGAAAQTTAVAVKHYWQRGFPAGAKWSTFKSNAANAANLEQYLTSNGFTLVDTSVQTPSVLNATITAITSASIPVVQNSGTNGLSAGDVVRLINVAGGTQLGGVEFTVGYNTLTSSTFSLDYMPQIVAATTGSWRKINYNPIFYPRHRVITKITKAQQAVITFSVTHGYQVGQSIRLSVPAVFGMTEMDGLQATILAVDTTTTTGNTVTVNIDSSSFTTFAWPTTGQYNAFTLAQATPIGEDTAYALAQGVNILSDATVNEAQIGLLLAGGAGNPAGAASDQIYWVAGKSWNVDNRI